MVDLALAEDVHQVDSQVAEDHQAEEALVTDPKENADLQEIENLSVKKEVLVQIVVHRVLEIENREVSEENQNTKSSKIVN